MVFVFPNAPANISQDIKTDIIELGDKLHSILKTKYGSYVGILAIELFLTMDNQILINEISPRVHNSGHFTIEGCKTSQFMNYIRTIIGMQSGDCNLIKSDISVHMTNILGGINDELLDQYNISSKRAGYHKTKGWRNPYRRLRKLGHYTK